jgi:hypothetical protein
MLGDILYQQSAKDVGSLGLEIFARSYIKNYGAAIDHVYVGVQVPVDRVLILGSVDLFNAPGDEAVYPYYMSVAWQDWGTQDTPANLNNFIIASGTDNSWRTQNGIIVANGGAAIVLDVWMSMSWQFNGSVLVPPGKGIYGFVQFDTNTGEAGNFRICVHGITIPRGNISFSS